MSYTNEDLAREYFLVDSQCCSDIFEKVGITRIIKTAETDIYHFYRENHKIPKIKRIGKKTRRILELILEQGFEKALEIIAQERIQTIRASILFDDRPKPRILNNTNPFS